MVRVEDEPAWVAVANGRECARECVRACNYCDYTRRRERESEVEVEERWTRSKRQKEMKRNELDGRLTHLTLPYPTATQILIIFLMSGVGGR